MSAAGAPVLVAGAGPAGLTLAIALRLAGVEATVVDRAPAPKREPRAAVVWPRTAETLARLGLGSRLAAAGLPLAAAHVHVRGRERGVLRFGALPLATPRPLVIEQGDVERLLLARFVELGGEVRWGVALDGVEAEGGAPVARLEGPGGPETGRFAYVVGAEGARSGVRRAMGVRFQGRPRTDVVCLQANTRPRWRFADRPGEGRVFLGEHATLGAFTTPAGDHRLYIFMRDDDPARRAPPTLAELERRVARVTGDPGVRLEPPAVPWLNFARFQERIAERLRVGPLLLCGDAAHVWPAVGGHGMAVAIAGAERLAGGLAQALGGGGEAGLDAYDRSQRALARRAMRLADLDLLERPHGPLALAVLGVALPPLLAAPTVAAGLERLLASLGHPAAGAAPAPV